jgi:hypothetical protein
MDARPRPIAVVRWLGGESLTPWDRISTRSGVSTRPLCSDYRAAVVASRKAIAADRKYLEKIGQFDYYTAGCCHDYHQLMFAAMFLGQFQTAIEAGDGMNALLTEEVLRAHIPSLAITLKSYYSMRRHVLVRFQPRLDLAMSCADVDIKASCACRQVPECCQ